MSSTSLVIINISKMGGPVVPTRLAVDEKASVIHNELC